MVGPAGLTLIVNGQPFEASGLAFSGSLFGTLGVQPALGRGYTAEEDFGGDDTLIVLTHEFWQRQLGGRADVLGMTLSTNDGARTVIGVMPPGFTVVGQKADFLAPYGETLEQLRAASGRGSSYAIARLRDGVSFEQAYGDMRAIYAQLEKEEPQRNARRTVMVFPLQEQTGRRAAAGAVRADRRGRAGDAGRLRQRRQPAAGAKRGARARGRPAHGARRRAPPPGPPDADRKPGARRRRRRRRPGRRGAVPRGLLALVGDRIPIPRLDQVTLDLPVLAFTMILALATGLAFGLVPAFVSTSHANEALRDGGRHGGGRRLHRVLGMLVVAEVALSLVLLAGAGLLMRSLIRLQQHRPWLPGGRRADRGGAAAGARATTCRGPA